MHAQYPHKRVLVEVLGEAAVMDLVEKHGDEAVPAVFAMMIESPEWSTSDAYWFVMEHFEGVFEELGDYFASKYFEHMQQALTVYGAEHDIAWPNDPESMLNEIDWNTFAQRLAGHTFFAYQTLFEDESKQYFVFKMDPGAPNANGGSVR